MKATEKNSKNKHSLKRYIKHIEKREKIKYTFRFSFKSMIHCYKSEETTEWEDTLSAILNKELKEQVIQSTNGQMTE